MKSWIVVIFFFYDSLFFGTLSLFDQTHSKFDLNYAYYNIILAIVVAALVGIKLIAMLKSNNFKVPISKVQVVFFLAALSTCVLIGYLKFSSSGFMTSIISYFMGFTIPAIVLALSVSERNLNGVYDKIKYINVYITLCFALSLFNNSNSDYGMLVSLGGASHLLVGYAMSALFAYNLLKFINHKRMVFKLFYLIMMALNILLIVFSGSRGALVSVAVILLIASFKYFLNRKRIIMLGVLVLLMFGLFKFINESEYFSFATDRISLAFNADSDQSSQERFVLYRTAINLFNESPIFGNAIGSFSQALNMYNYPHNIGIEILNDFGIFGLSIALFILFLIAKKCKLLLKQTTEYQLIVFLFVNVFIQLVFSGSYLVSSQFWLTAVLIWVTKNNSLIDAPLKSHSKMVVRNYEQTT